LKIFEYSIKRRGSHVEKTNDRRGQIWHLGPNMAPGKGARQIGIKKA
jgi:hypothetical protein